MGRFGAAPGGGGRLAEHLRPREPDAARVAQAGAGARAQRCWARNRSARKSSSSSVDKFGATPRWRASWSRSIARTSRNWSIPSTAPTSARSTRRSRPPTPSTIPYAPERIDWADYWINVHLPGLRRHIFGSLDLHTRGRPSRSGAPSHAGRNARPRRRALRLAARTDRAAAVGRAHHDHLSRAARQCASRRPAARDARGQGGRSRAADRRELARVGARVFRDSLRRRGRRAARPSDFAPTSWRPSAASPSPPRRCVRARSPSAWAARSASSTAKSSNSNSPSSPSVRSAGAARRAAPPPERKTLASIVFTSGTTGAPKGVMLTHGNFAAEVAMLARVFALDSADVVLSLLPLHHTFEFTCGMLLPLAQRRDDRLSARRRRRKSLAHARRRAADRADRRARGVGGGPSAHRRRSRSARSVSPRAVRQPARSQSQARQRIGPQLGSLLFRQAHTALGGRLRLAVSGGAALPQRVAELFQRHRHSAARRLRPDRSRAGAERRAPGRTARGGIGRQAAERRRDQARRPATATVGEILARGPNVMAGYYRNQAATDEVLHDGWLHTGDLGRFDEDGRLYIVGRAKDVIVDSGGNNIYIDELEEIYGHSSFIKETGGRRPEGRPGRAGRRAGGAGLRAR